MVSLSTKLTVSGLSPPSFYATRSKVSRKRKKKGASGSVLPWSSSRRLPNGTPEIAAILFFFLLRVTIKARVSAGRI